jgi:hypothetical protein
VRAGDRPLTVAQRVFFALAFVILLVWVFFIPGGLQ